MNRSNYRDLCRWLDTASEKELAERKKVVEELMEDQRDLADSRDVKLILRLIEEEETARRELRRCRR